ncbi:MAG: hypothetical protein HQM11_11210 [SAR324 cluster bacterium]|nr:hypothetical protein [SAR324 cluster bacterium]
MLRWFAVSILLILSGCGGGYTPPSAGSQLLHWKGKAITELFQNRYWGYPPDELIKESETMIYVYNKSHVASGNVGSNRVVQNKPCIARFYVVGDMIENVIAEGTCPAK